MPAVERKARRVRSLIRRGVFEFPHLPRPIFLPWHAIPYLISLPERIIRSAAGWCGGLLFSASRLLPRPIRNSRFFRVAVLKMLKVVTDSIGQAGVFDGEPEEEGGEGYVPRKLVGSTIDNAAIILFHASPIWFILAFSDLTRGASAYAKELATELKKAGVIDEGSTIDSVDALLESVSKVTGDVGETLDTPPLSLKQMRTIAESVKEGAGDLDQAPAGLSQDINKLADELVEVARLEGRSLLEISTGLATYVSGKAARGAYGAGLGLVKGVEVGARMAHREIVQDYLEGLSEVRRIGLYALIAQGLAPYAGATRANFHPKMLSITELILSFGAWRNAAWRARKSRAPKPL